jgi:hypothetical protein
MPKIFLLLGEETKMNSLKLRLHRRRQVAKTQAAVDVFTYLGTLGS